MASVGTVLSCTALLLLGCCLSEAAAADPGRITDLPGANFTISFDQFSGFATVNETHGRKLFYWFATSQRDPKTDPLVLWLTGGPGCSSMAGLFLELGPFYPLSDGKTLAQNPYSWNQVANVIFLESPCGVGFSYSTPPQSVYTTGDEQTTQDTLQFLIKFFEMYPEYTGRDFWVTGESYGGHYVPLISAAVLDYNSMGPKTPINIKGFLVGNPWTDPYSDNLGTTTFWEETGIISNKTFNILLNNCNFSTEGPVYLMMKKLGINLFSKPRNQSECDQAMAEAESEMGNINQYSIYVDVCTKFGNGKGKRPNVEMVGQQDPCIENYLTKYLNQQDVIKAIHASDSPNKWTLCSGIVNYSSADVHTSVLPVYRRFFAEKKLRMLVYSGDVDGVVAHTGTEMWLSLLNLTVKESFKSWTASNGQVGGYTVKYDELTYTTVRGAGHQVPGFKPLYALDMFKGFVGL